jgi:hypothetical protein
LDGGAFAPAEHAALVALALAGVLDAPAGADADEDDGSPEDDDPHAATNSAAPTTTAGTRRRTRRV